MHSVMEFPTSVTSRFADKRGAVVHTDMGSLINVDHGKFILVLKKIDGVIGYCVINSKRYNIDPESKVQISFNDQPIITNKDFPGLKKDKSYVNCGNVGLIEESEFNYRIRSGVFQYVGSIELEKMQDILARGQSCKVLKPFQKLFFSP